MSGDLSAFAHLPAKPWLPAAMKALAASPSGFIVLSPSASRDKPIFNGSEVDLLTAQSMLAQLERSGSVRVSNPQGAFGKGSRVELLDADILSAIFQWSPKAPPVESLRRALVGYGVDQALAAVAATSCAGCPVPPERIAKALLSAKASIPTRHSVRRFSCEHFWSDSKFLDSKEALRSALGLDENAPQPILLNLHLPPDFERLLWIENLDTFHYFIEHQILGHPVLAGRALVYAQGFKGASPRIRDPKHRILSFCGHAHLSTRAASLLDNETTAIEFFGDLDPAGLAILCALRKSFPLARAWQPGYEFLARLLERDDGGHYPNETAKTKQAPLQTTGCSFADSRLAPLLASTNKMLDQEAFRFA